MYSAPNDGSVTLTLFVHIVEVSLDKTENSTLSLESDTGESMRVVGLKEHNALENYKAGGLFFVFFFFKKVTFFIY